MTVSKHKPGTPLYCSSPLLVGVGAGRSRIMETFSFASIYQYQGGVKDKKQATVCWTGHRSTFIKDLLLFWGQAPPGC